MDKKDLPTEPSKNPESAALGYSQWKNDFLRVVMLVSCFLFLIITITAWSSNTPNTKLTYGALVILLAFVSIARVPYTIRALVFLSTLFYTATNLLLIWGIEGEATMVYLAVIALAAIFYERPVEYLVMALTAAAIITIAVLTINGSHILSGWIPLGDQVHTVMIGLWGDWIVYVVDLLGVSIILVSAIRFLKREFNRVLNKSTTVVNELASSRTQLETRFEERTADLNKATTELQNAMQVTGRRARQFEAIAQVARAIASVQDLDLLLPRIAELISRQFGFYHVGIFMLDEHRTFAVLAAANSEGGRKMLVREHKLQVGQTGIVGYVTGTGNPRIALDTGEDAYFFDNPDLPETRSEMALPLRVADQPIGALDIQSREPNAFGQEDIEVLSTLADQVSIAIQNARSFQETRRMLAEAQTAIGGYLTEAWKVLQPASLGKGYQGAGASVRPLERPITGDHIRQAIKKGETVMSDNQGNAHLAIPLRLRGQIIGVLNLQVPTGHKWNPDEVDIAEAVAERLSLAIESAALLEETRRRAERERLVTDITTRIRGSGDPEEMIRTAIAELRRALGVTRVEIVPQTVSNPPGNN
jgi:GAF domain-containing protein